MPTYKLYEELGVSQNASKDEIKKAYRKLAVVNHPDKGGDPEKFKSIANAYQVLGDDEKRNMYDQLGDEQFSENGGGGGGGMHEMDPNIIFRDLFSQFDFGGFGGFGGHGHNPQPGPKRRNDHMHHLRISQADAYHGMRKTVKISLQKTCLKDSCSQTCFACQGRGQITDMRRMGFMTQMMTRACDTCKGTGKIVKGVDRCGECKGHGKFTEDIMYELHIPAGVATGHRVVCGGYGEQACVIGETPGDLVFEIVVQGDPNFQRQGNDLVYSVKLSFFESILGKQISVPHYANTFDFNTGDYGIIQPNKPYIIKGKGMTSDSNLILVFHIDYPAKVFTEEEKQILETTFKQVQIQ